MIQGTVECQSCKEPVQLTRENRSLKARCGCDKVNVKVSQVLPEVWE